MIHNQHGPVSCRNTRQCVSAANEVTMAVKGSDIYASRVDGEGYEPYLQAEEDVRASLERLPTASPTVHARFTKRSSLAGKGAFRSHARIVSR